MPSCRVAIVGGGIAGLCLAASLTQLNRQSAVSVSDTNPIHVDIYEAAEQFVEFGAGITLWGRVCEALRLMGMDEDCVRASVVVASTSGESATNGFILRGFRDDADYGRLPFRDAWSLHRVDLVNILVRRIPSTCIRFRKRFVGYHNPSNFPITLTFSDGTTATCDVLVGADGLRSAVRTQLMRDASSLQPELKSHINPRFTGTLAYRALLPLEALRTRNPKHSFLRGGVVYFGKSQHIVGYPISSETLNLAVNITNLAHVDTEWPPCPSQSTSEYKSPSISPYPPSSSSGAQSQHYPRSWHPPLSTRESSVGSRRLDRASFRREVAPKFVGWGKEVDEVIECIDTCIEWPVMDLNPLPFYTRGRVVLMGDAAHAAVPYVGAGAAFAIEDAYILSHLIHAASTSTQAQHCPFPRYPRTSNPMDLALHAYERIRLPRGNALVESARVALRSFQFDGPCGDDMRGAAGHVCEVFEEAAGVSRAVHGKMVEEGCWKGPKEDMEWGVARVLLGSV